MQVLHPRTPEEPFGASVVSGGGVLFILVDELGVTCHRAGNYPLGAEGTHGYRVGLVLVE